ncbi:hypothetical protein Tco_1413728 [Tanacetum coccineum]
MSPHHHEKFRMGVAIAKGCKGYYKPGIKAWVRRGSCKIRIPIDMYPCRVEERLTIKLVKGEEVLKIETTVTAKDVIRIWSPRLGVDLGTVRWKIQRGSGIRINA